MRTKSRTLSLGTISEGTLRPEDLIPAYLSALEDMRLTRSVRQTVQRLRREYDALPDGNRWNGHDEPVIDWTDQQQNDAGDMLEELTDLLENHVPDYCYFGSLEGDGACFGVWPLLESVEEDCRTRRSYLDPNDPRGHDATVAKVNAGDPFPAGADHVLSVTDHGNCTLYRRAGRRWIEVWSVV